MNRSRTRPVGLAASLALILTAATTAPAGSKHRGLQLHKSLPKDPLLVLAVSVDDPANELDSLLRMFEQFQDQADGSPVPIDDIGGALSGLLPRGLLDSIGPEIVISVDLPPIDETLVAVQASGAETFDVLLREVGFLTEVKDAKRLDASLRLMLSAFGAKLVEHEGLVHANLPVEGLPTEAAVNVFYRIRKGRMALGFSEAWVEATIDGRQAGERLTDGEDFARVFSQLDAKPSDLTYINLPRIREYVTGSQIVRGLAETNAEVRLLVERFFTPETMGVGLGATSVTMDRGVRTTNFGPPWMSGAVMSSGTLVAMAMPTLMSAVDEGRAQRTLDDIEAIARACEGFSEDSATYPGPTEGWVTVDTLSAYLEPVYIGTLPRHDAWQNPLLYWSDGGSYRIISTGKDGRMERDWSAIIGIDGTEPALAGDIVYGDGHLMVVTERISGD